MGWWEITIRLLMDWRQQTKRKPVIVKTLVYWWALWPGPETIALYIASASIKHPPVWCINFVIKTHSGASSLWNMKAIGNDPLLAVARRPCEVEQFRAWQQRPHTMALFDPERQQIDVFKYWDKSYSEADMKRTTYISKSECPMSYVSCIWRPYKHVVMWKQGANHTDQSPRWSSQLHSPLHSPA